MRTQIELPHEVAAELAGSQDVVLRKPLRDERTEHALDGDVDLGDEIDRPFLVNAHGTAEVRELDVAGADDGLDGGGEEQRIGRHVMGWSRRRCARA